MAQTAEKSNISPSPPPSSGCFQAAGPPPALQTLPKFHEKTPKREKKERKLSRNDQTQSLAMLGHGRI